jgi:hypothetical protein
MSLIDILKQAASPLTDDLDALRDDTPRSLERVWGQLVRLLTARAPSGGCLLPGAIGGVVADLAEELGLKEDFIPEIGSSGNPGISLGARVDAVDIVITAHIDRPSFRVRDVTLGDGGLLYPICADRFPEGEYRAQALALRWEPGEGLTVGARGQFIAQRGTGGDHYRFVNQEGQLAAHDVITLDATPTLIDGAITGTGLDNCLGALSALHAAHILKGVEGVLTQAGRRIVIAFTDLEEGVPTAFFGHGAARLMGALPQPRIGAIVCDGHIAALG